ncbi:hypothetical protein [Pseudoduganella violacea]|uniref:Fimbrial assembly protein n=1 Tax=Pseudoduganella violacea TaxID=1715466 RepID=A0A7W5BCJ0_9BURK|nr:hypothetical protein [Pseudoduganella violacea]MBB3120598.1 hypothetical protein [Pseudoduganella violacea]
MRLSRLNFLPKPALPGASAITLCVTACLVLLLSALNWMVQRQAVEKLEQQLADAAHKRPTQRTSNPARQRELEQQTKTMVAAAREQNLSAARLLRHIQAPRDLPITLLGLDLNSQRDAENRKAGISSGSVKISAEAATLLDMLNYLAYLNEQPMFQSVYLVKHEMVEGRASPPAAA